MAVVTSTEGLPSQVAIALQDLLWGNVTKVLISVAVWLPYLQGQHHLTAAAWLRYKDTRVLLA
jgi:hypothetical protein